MSSSGSRVDPGNDDDQVSKEIISLMKYKENVFLLRGDYSPKELRAFFRQMDLVIGMRMHSLVLASTMNVPVIGIALSPKFHSFFKLIGQSEYLMTLNNVNYSNLLEKIETALSKGESIRKGLKLTKNTLQKLALYNVKYVQAMLRNRS